MPATMARMYALIRDFSPVFELKSRLLSDPIHLEIKTVILNDPWRLPVAGTIPIPLVTADARAQNRLLGTGPAPETCGHESPVGSLFARLRHWKANYNAVCLQIADQ
jgi:hypothetical protein